MSQIIVGTIRLMNGAVNKVLVNSKLPVSSFRIGQISGGPPRGAWSATDWLPIIVKSSVNLGALPEARGVSCCVFIEGTHLQYSV
jgi:thioester reductase-like protein